MKAGMTMKEIIQDRLAQIGDNSTLVSIDQVAGGDINQAFRVQTEQSNYFVKANSQVPPHFFEVEAHGLSLIEASETIHVPHVHYYDRPHEDELAVMVMDWIEGHPSTHTASELGTKLANMHLHTNNQHGFDKDTFVGTLPQRNELCQDWLTYYKQQRLGQQLKIANERGRLPTKRRKNLEKVIDQLGKWVNHNPEASLLHGDLWGGNWIAGPDGHPYLIDPSILYGDRAFEIAFTELFGGFSSDFYHAYQEANPLPENYQEIKPLYQLYYLLVHLNMFGESYGNSVDRILNHYV